MTRVARAELVGCRTVVRAGQVYRARGGGGPRYVRIAQVRGLGQELPYATARVVSRAGRPLRGRSPSGVDRRFPIRISLTWNGDAWALPSRYQLVQLDTEASA